MRVRLVCLEDGITSCGFRKIAAYVSRLNPDTESCYISTNRYRSLKNAVRGTYGGKGEMDDGEVNEIAHALAGSDLVGFSSMTGYAELTRRVIRRLREIDPTTFILWGGIHPIIHPEDAILADVDAICNGEGEFAFEEFFKLFREGGDYTRVANFWFKNKDGKVIRNGFRPLMTQEEMETLPFPQFGTDRERIYRTGQGFVPMELADYLANDGLGYSTLWSIGCPFHCTFCGNTKFIANDPLYKKIRHPSARYMVDEIKSVRKRFPHVSQVSFHDDSFMAIPYKELEKFAELWREELGIPFAVYGVIPNYVKQDKFEILTWAGMNRIRMGIQSGSQTILDFYRRPTPPERILEAGTVIASFAPKYHIPAAYDIIMDNPIETRQDVIDTLELLYRMPRPYTLFIFSLKVIPNTQMEQAMKDLGIDLEEISANYAVIPPRAANLILYVLAICRPPRKLFDWALRRVEGSATPQPTYPKLGKVLRIAYQAKRVLDHLRFMDFSIIPGWSGYIAWRVGLVRFWQKRFNPRPPRPPRKVPREPGSLAGTPVASPVRLTAARAKRPDSAAG